MCACMVCVLCVYVRIADFFLVSVCMNFCKCVCLFHFLFFFVYVYVCLSCQSVLCAIMFIVYTLCILSTCLTM